MENIEIAKMTIEVDVDSKQADHQIKDLNKSIKGIGTDRKGGFGGISKSFKHFGIATAGIAVAVDKITTYMGRAFKDANDYVERMNLLAVSMGESAKEASAFALKAQEKMGIDASEFLEYQGSFNQLLEGYGLANNITSKMSRSLAELSYDLSSLWNVDVSNAFHKLQSGMSGQIKGLKVWGINVSIAAIRETALAHGITLSTSKMTEAQKATLRYLTIMEKTSNAQGDLARTIITPANSLRIMNTQWQLARRYIGQFISVIAVKLIPYVSAAVSLLKDAAQALARLFGYKLPEIDYSGITGLGGAIDDVTDGFGSATAAAKKLQRTILGIDEINKLEDPKEKAGGGFGGGGNGYADDFGLDLPVYNFMDELAKKTDIIKGKLKKVLKIIGLIGIATGIAMLGKKIFDVTKNIVLFVQAVGGAKTFVEMLGISTGEAVKEIMGLSVAGSSVKLGGLIAGIGVAVAVIGTLIAAIKNAYEHNEHFRKGIEVLGEMATRVFDRVGEAIKSVGKWLYNLIPESVRKRIADFIDMIKNSWGDALLSSIPLVKDFYNWIKDLGKRFEESGMSVEEFVDTIEAELGQKLINAWNTIKAGFKRMFDAFSEFGHNIHVWFKNLTSNIWGFFTGMWDDIVNSFKDIGPSIKNGFKGIWDEITRFFNSAIKSKLTKEAWKKRFQGITDGAKAVLDDLKSKFENFTAKIKTPHITWIADGQKATGTIKKVLEKLSLPTTLPKLSVSWYAQGGFPKSGQLFMAREAGAEMVGSIGGKTAVANNDQIVTSVSQGVYEANMEQNALLRQMISVLMEISDKDAVANVNVNDILDGIQRKNRRDGRTTVPIGY